MPITYFEQSKTFKLDTPNSTYLFKLECGVIPVHMYYGAWIPDTDLGYLRRGYGRQRMKDYPIRPESEMLEFSCDGCGDFRPPAFELIGKDGTGVTDLRYLSHRIYNGKPKLEGLPATYATDEEAQTLELVCVDEVNRAEVTLIYSVFAAYDVITRSVRIRNTGEASFTIRKAYSACVDYPTQKYSVLTLNGMWAGERNIAVQPLQPGRFSIGSMRGASSAQFNPFLALLADGSTEESGEVYGYSFVYSGNFSAMADCSPYGGTRVLMGLNPDHFAWVLGAGESFQTPEVVMVYSDHGLGGMSRTYHRLYRKNLCRGPWRDCRRPILVNNWEGTYFDFTDDKIVSIAKDAAELGIEMLVMDDGWFGHRDDDTTSLGDWYVYEKKFPNGGLPAMVKRITDLGLRFGIWFEPEMISPDSDLYRAHPDWCLHVDGRPGALGRNQLVLDMTRKDVRDNVFEQMAAILRSCEISYVKWDFNRDLTEVGSALLSAEHQGEVFHRYVLGLYELTERLLTEFPHLLLEGCASGGGRFDPGMLYYAPQIWTSDNSDAQDRINIQYGTSIVYPSSAISAHVSASPNHQTGRVTSFKTRGDVALAGGFGYELDLNQLTDEERALVRKQIENYNKYDRVVHEGDLYRLISPVNHSPECAWMYVAPDKSEALVTFALVRHEIDRPHYVRLAGLDPDKQYRDNVTGRVLSGKTLMSVGMNFASGYGRLLDGTTYVVHLEQV